MPGFGALLWELLTAGGGFVALTFIVALALGIAVLALLFLASAVVGLERFARVASSWRSILGFGVLWAGVIGAGLLASVDLDPVLTDGWSPLVVWLAASAGSFGLIAAVAVGLRLLLRRIDPTTLATATVLVLGLGYALVVGGLGQVGYAGVPMLVAAGLAALLAWRRVDARPSATERLLRLLAAILVVGVLLAALLPAPEPRASLAGGLLLYAFVLCVLLGLVPLAVAGFYDTRRNAEWFIAVRYLVAKRRQTFISVITGICVVGIAAGVWLIITVLSVMNGFERTWRDEIIGNRAHFTVHSRLGPIENYEDLLSTVTAIPEVVAASPYLDAEGMVRGAQGQIIAVRVRGVDPALAGDVTDLREDLVEGSLDDLARDAYTADLDPAIVIGSQLAGALGVGVGDPLLVISPFGGPQTPLGPAPRLKRFEIAGVFESSFFQYDEMFTYVSLPAAQDFRRSADVVDGIEARTTDFYRSRQVADAVEQALGLPYYTRDWKEFFPAFFQALKSERIMMFVLLTMIMVVAAFAIVSTLVMMIMEKSSDIAILKAMGAEDDAIERIFAIEGTLIGLVGTVLGVVAGISVTAQIAWIQRQIEAITGIDTLPASVYQFSTLPAELDAGQIAIAVGIAMILALGATLLPSRQAARLDPVEALRYE
jgi:lipoprotein-releasing system permease protein